MARLNTSKTSATGPNTPNWAAQNAPTPASDIWLSCRLAFSPRCRIVINPLLIFHSQVGSEVANTITTKVKNNPARRRPGRLPSLSTQSSTPAMKYSPAYLASADSPIQIPLHTIQPYSARFEPIALTKQNRPAHQNNSIGVSVDITKLPRPTLGRLAHKIAASRPVAAENNRAPVCHRISAIRKWASGAVMRKPIICALNRLSVSDNIQAISGGLE